MPRLGRSRRTVTTIGVVGVALLILGVFVAMEIRDRPATKAATEPDDARLVAAAGHVLQTAPDGAPVFVEFLDFECEACGALYPVVEDLREAYQGEVTFVTRYFPLPGHPNSRTAAHAAEAAARQGQYEAMYQRLFETQTEWSHTDEDRSPVFRGYAAELGLDMAQYDRDVTSTDVAARVEADYEDALSLGLSGTPSLFLDGKRLEPRTLAEFRSAFENAVAD